MLTVTTAAIKNNERQELEQTFWDYAQFIYRTAFGVTGRREDAEDILQTVFLRLLQRDSLPDLEKSPRAYLYRAAVNLSLDTIRSRRRHTINDIDTLDLPARANDHDIDEDLHRKLYEDRRGFARVVAGGT
jgi:RNA polymerase sigma factor (sigma-70 family)